ncbi:unnamed protein product, partial [marine sediment metagenome]
QEGIESVKKEKPDIVLLDIILRDKKGIEFIEKIKEYPEFQNIPIIAFSNFNEKEMKDRAVKLGAKEYLIKSDHTPGEIVNKINEYLKK